MVVLLVLMTIPEIGSRKTDFNPRVILYITISQSMFLCVVCRVCSHLVSKQTRDLKRSRFANSTKYLFYCLEVAGSGSRPRKKIGVSLS
jgi:hypothetical protein